MDLSAGAGSRLPRAVTACAAVAVVALFYAAKVGLFKGLHYTFDLFSFVQMSRGWLRGHALLHENGYGNHGQVHNYYTILVFGPLSQLWGAYGLFLGHMLLLLGAAVALIRAAPVGSPAAAADIGSVFAMLLGPVSFWLLDDFTYGWHVELLYLPLGILFAIAREHRSPWALLWGAAIVLSKEDGAVLLFSLLALESLRPLIAGEPGIARRLSRVTGLCLGLFALGMLFLRWKNYPVPHMWGQERVRSAFENLSLLRNVPHQAAALAQLRGGAAAAPGPVRRSAGGAIANRVATSRTGAGALGLRHGAARDRRQRREPGVRVATASVRLAWLELASALRFAVDGRCGGAFPAGAPARRRFEASKPWVARAGSGGSHSCDDDDIAHRARLRTSLSNRAGSWALCQCGWRATLCGRRKRLRSDRECPAMAR